MFKAFILLFLLCFFTAAVQGDGTGREEVCMFIGYRHDYRGPKINFKTDHTNLKATMDLARTRSFWLEIENTKANPYTLRYRSQPFEAMLLRDGRIIGLESLGRNEYFARDGDLIVIRVTGRKEDEWPSFEGELFAYYESVDLLRMSPWEKRKLRALIRKSASLLVSRVTCISTVQLFPFVSSDYFDDSSSTNQQSSTSATDTRDGTSSTD